MSQKRLTSLVHDQCRNETSGGPHVNRPHLAPLPLGFMVRWLQLYIAGRRDYKPLVIVLNCAKFKTINRKIIGNSARDRPIVVF